MAQLSLAVEAIPKETQLDVEKVSAILQKWRKESENRSVRLETLYGKLDSPLVVGPASWRGSLKDWIASKRSRIARYV